MTIKRKPAIRAKPPDYICTEKEQIKILIENNSKLSVIILGNGDPKKGMFYQFSEFMIDHKQVVSDINEIKGKVTEAIDSSGKAIRAIDSYKKETEAFEEGSKEKEAKIRIAEALERTKKRDKSTLLFNIIAAVVTLTAVLFSILKSDKNANKIMTDQEYMDYKMMFKADKDFSKAPTRGNYVLYGDSIQNKDSLK